MSVSSGTNGNSTTRNLTKVAAACLGSAAAGAALVYLVMRTASRASSSSAQHEQGQTQENSGRAEKAAEATNKKKSETLSASDDGGSTTAANTLVNDKSNINNQKSDAETLLRWAADFCSRAALTTAPSVPELPALSGGSDTKSVGALTSAAKIIVDAAVKQQQRVLHNASTSSPPTTSGSLDAPTTASSKPQQQPQPSQQQKFKTGLAAITTTTSTQGAAATTAEQKEKLLERLRQQASQLRRSHSSAEEQRNVFKYFSLCMTSLLECAGDPLAVAVALAESIRGLVHADRCTVFVANEKTRTLSASIQGKHIELKYGEGIAGRAAAERKADFVNNAYEHVRFNASVDAEVGYVTKTLLTMPLVFEGELLAVVQLVNKQAEEAEASPAASESTTTAAAPPKFGDADLEIFEAFVAVAGVVIHDALSRPELRRLTRSNRVMSDICANLVAADLHTPTDVAHAVAAGVRRCIPGARAVAVASVDSIRAATSPFSAAGLNFAGAATGGAGGGCGAVSYGVPFGRRRLSGNISFRELQQQQRNRARSPPVLLLQNSNNSSNANNTASNNNNNSAGENDGFMSRSGIVDIPLLEETDPLVLNDDFSQTIYNNNNNNNDTNNAGRLCEVLAHSLAVDMAAVALDENLVAECLQKLDAARSNRPIAGLVVPAAARDGGDVSSMSESPVDDQHGHSGNFSGSGFGGSRRSAAAAAAAARRRRLRNGGYIFCMPLVPFPADDPDQCWVVQIVVVPPPSIADDSGTPITFHIESVFDSLNNNNNNNNNNNKNNNNACIDGSGSASSSSVSSMCMSGPPATTALDVQRAVSWLVPLVEAVIRNSCAIAWQQQQAESFQRMSKILERVSGDLSRFTDPSRPLEHVAREIELLAGGGPHGSHTVVLFFRSKDDNMSTAGTEQVEMVPRLHSASSPSTNLGDSHHPHSHHQSSAAGRRQSFAAGGAGSASALLSPTLNADSFAAPPPPPLFFSSTSTAIYSSSQQSQQFDYHSDAGSGPVVMPVPLRGGSAGSAGGGGSAGSGAGGASSPSSSPHHHHHQHFGQLQQSQVFAAASSSSDIHPVMLGEGVVGMAAARKEPTYFGPGQVYAAMERGEFGIYGALKDQQQSGRSTPRGETGNTTNNSDTSSNANTAVGGGGTRSRSPVLPGTSGASSPSGYSQINEGTTALVFPLYHKHLRLGALCLLDPHPQIFATAIRNAMSAVSASKSLAASMRGESQQQNLHEQQQRSFHRRHGDKNSSHHHTSSSSTIFSEQFQRAYEVFEFLLAVSRFSLRTALMIADAVRQSSLSVSKYELNTASRRLRAASSSPQWAAAMSGHVVSNDDDNNNNAGGGGASTSVFNMDLGSGNPLLLHVFNDSTSTLPLYASMNSNSGSSKHGLSLFNNESVAEVTVEQELLDAAANSNFDFPIWKFADGEQPPAKLVKILLHLFKNLDQPPSCTSSPTTASGSNNGNSNNASNSIVSPSSQAAEAAPPLSSSHSASATSAPLSVSFDVEREQPLPLRSTLATLNIDEGTLLQTIAAALRRYRDVPYHSAFHAFDVTQSCYRMMRLSGLCEVLTQAERFALLLSALFHDVDHNGLNNNYHIKAETEIGLMGRLSGQKSVLELHHCQTAVRIIGKTGLLRNTERSDSKRIMQLLFSNVLATDMASHKDIIACIDDQLLFTPDDEEEFLNATMSAAATALAVASNNSNNNNNNNSASNIINNNGGKSAVDDAAAMSAFDPSLEEHRELAMRLCLKMADISNPSKDFNISRRWGLAITEEFHRQGDVERAEGREISPMCDREVKSELHKSQIFFISHIVTPYFTLCAKVFPKLQCVVENLNANLERWKKVAAANK